MTTAARSSLLTLALCAMVLRALLPVGWMPDPGGMADGPLVICTMHGAHHISPGHRPAHSPDEHGSICPFAAAAHFAPPQMAVAVAAPVTFAWAPFPNLSQSAPRVSVNLAHEPRGPPLPV